MTGKEGDMMTIKPEVFLLGAQKAGTTSLAFLLEQHPDIGVTYPKEPHFFSRHFNGSSKWYKALFRGQENQLSIDASTSYSMRPYDEENFQWKKMHERMYPYTAERVYEWNPGAKFIYIMRSPVERTYSSYWHSVRHHRENRSFDEVIKDHRCRYIAASDYAHQLEPWLRLFPRSQFLLLDFQDFKNAPQKTLDECFHFLGIKAYHAAAFDIKNKTYFPSKTARTFNYMIKRFPAVTRVQKAAPSVLKDKVQKWRKGKATVPPMSAAQRRELEAVFEEPVNRLEEMTGMDFSHWKVYRENKEKVL
jgi:hypothetical protein